MRLVCSLAGILALAAALPAQTVSPPGILPILTPAIAELKQYLNLTDSQVVSLQNLLQQKTLAQQQTAAQIAQKNLALQSLLGAASPNPTAVGQAYIDIQNLEKQLAAAGDPFHTQALAVLMPSQATLLANLNTALQLQTAACEAVNVNLLALPSIASQFGTIQVVSSVATCPALPARIVPVFTPVPPPQG